MRLKRKGELVFHVTETEHTSVLPGRVYFPSLELTLCLFINHACVDSYTGGRTYTHTLTRTHSLPLSLSHTQTIKAHLMHIALISNTLFFSANVPTKWDLHQCTTVTTSNWVIDRRGVWNDIMILVLKVRNTKSHWSTKWLPLEQSGCCKFEEHDRPPRGTISLVCMIFSKKVTVHTYIKLSIYYRILQILQIQQTCWRVGRYYSIIRLNGGIKTSAEIIFMRLSDK